MSNNTIEIPVNEYRELMADVKEIKAELINRKENPIHSDGLITAKEALQLLGYKTLPSLLHLEREGLLHPKRIGRRTWYDRDEVISRMKPTV